MSTAEPMASWRAYVARARPNVAPATLNAWRNMAARTCAPCSAVLVESDMALWRAMPPADARPADQCYLCGGALA